MTDTIFSESIIPLTEFESVIDVIDAVFCLSTIKSEITDIFLNYI